MTSPAFENRRSLATDVAGMAGYLRAKRATFGYVALFAAHQVSGQALCSMAGDDVYSDSSCMICSDSDDCAGVALAADARSFAKMPVTIGLVCEDDVVAVEVDGVGSDDSTGSARGISL